MNGRIIWMDYAKAVGIALVVFAHMPSRFAGIIFLFHMPLFFMLSGYLYKSIGLKNELKRSFLCLIIPYLAYNGILLLFSAAQGDFNVSLIGDILLGNQEVLPGNYRALWFIISLFLMRLIMSMFQTDKSIITITLLSVLAFVTLRESGMIPFDRDWFQINTTLLCLPFFTSGILMKRHSLESMSDRINIGYKFVCLAVIGIALLFIGHANGGVNVFRCVTGKYLTIFYIVSFVISYAYIYAFYRLFKKENGIIKTVSLGTFLILSVHQTLILVISHFVQLNTLISLFCTLLILLVCYPFIRIGQRFFPLVLLGKRRRDKNEKRSYT